MAKSRIILYTTIFLILFFCLVYLFSTPSKQTRSSTRTQSEQPLYLKSYQNTVALYEGENIKEIFSDVVLNALPVKDQILLNQGILIEDKEQLYRLIEDFDG